MADKSGAEATTDWIYLSDPDMTQAELDAVQGVIASPRVSAGAVTESFEAAFAERLGRKYAVAVASGTMGLSLCLRAYGIGPGDEVIAAPHSWHQIANAILLVGAKPVFADIDYWAGTLSPEKAEGAITDKTRAILGGNTNGHPADWDLLRDIAVRNDLVLLEDSTEAIGSTYKDKLVGTFGDCAIFDFSQPSLLTCGEGGMVVTDDPEIASKLRNFRSRKLDERHSLVVTAYVPQQASMSNLAAALGLAQLKRLDRILEKRNQVAEWYYDAMKSFEGIKDPYMAPEATSVEWFLYVVHLGTRFSLSSRNAIIDDMKTENVEAAAYSYPTHLGRAYVDQGYRKGNFFVTEKVAERAIALPFHTHLTEEQVKFIVKTAKDASINVGAGSAIYL